MHPSFHLTAMLMAVGMLAAQESPPPKIIHHPVTAGNSIEELAPKDDGSRQYSMTSCGFHQSEAFRHGYTLGCLSGRKGDRYWIQSIEKDQSKESLALERRIHGFGHSLVVLTGFKDTPELRDQIAGFNMAMYGQMVIDYKKRTDR